MILQDSNTQQGTRKARLCEHHSISQACKALDLLNLVEKKGELVIDYVTFPQQESTCWEDSSKGHLLSVTVHKQRTFSIAHGRAQICWNQFSI